MSLLSNISARISDTTQHDKQLPVISAGVAKSTGPGVFHFDTRTEDTIGR